MFPGFPGEGAGRTRRGWNVSAEAAPGSNLSDILSPLLSRSRGALRAELESLARETDPRLFFEGLLGLGMRREAAGDLETAAEIYSAVVGAVPPLAGDEREGSLQARAQRQLDAILGRGTAGPRFEFLARRFAREASDPTMLLAMTAGSAVFTLSRASILSRLLASPTRNLLTQGLGARALASGGAFLLEVPAFWATGKGLREFAASDAQSWDLATNFHELAAAALTLGALKLTGFGSQSLYRRLAGPAGALRERPLQTLFHQTGMFAGIVLGHRLEEAAGLRRPVDGATTLLDSLVMLLQFNVGGRLSHQLLGPGWAGRVREMELRLQDLATRPRLPGPPLEIGLGWRPALATASGPRAGGGESLEALLSRPVLMAMEGEGGGDSAVKPMSAGESRRAAPLAPHAGETPTLWAMRLLETSREGEAQALMVAQVLESRLRDSRESPFAREAVERLVSMTDRMPEGQGILARRYSIPGLREPLTIVSLPTTFLPEQWSRVFAEGIVQEFRRNPLPVERAVEIGSGTGWVSILAAKLGLAREVVGVDRNPHAPVVGRLNAALNGVQGVSFRTGDLLAPLPEGMKADLILACLPQVPRNGGVESLRAVADYYPSEGTYWDRYGLGLIDRALGQARERLTEDGRILFNLGGRPGRPILEDLLARRGFHPGVRYGQLIQQDPTTDFSELARLEAGNRQRFEFFLREDPNTPISAAEAVGRPEVYHMLYLTEGRPYANLLRSALAAETAQPTRLGYTPDPGSEHEGLRRALAAELAPEWGVRLPSELLFLGPSSDLLLEGLLRVGLPEGGRVLYGGAAEAEPPAGLRRFNVIPMRPDPVAFQNAVETQRPDAVVLRLPREAWAAGEEFFPLFAAAVERRSHVVILEDHPLPAPGRAHPAAQYLSEHPEALPYIHLVQSLDRRYQSPAFPLAVAMTASSAIHGSLARYADVTYSRASSLVQGAYLRFLRELPRGILPGSALHGSIEPVLAPSLPDSPVSRTLSSRAAFESAPKGEHPDPIDMSFGESEWRAPLRLDTALLEALARPREVLDAEARAAVAQYLRESRGVDFAPEQIVLAAGVHPALEAAIRAIGAMEGKGVQVAVPQPSYGLFYPTIEIAGGRVAEFATRAEDRFLARPGMIPLPANDKGSRWVPALLLNEPTNPAGQYYSAEQWREIAGAIRGARGYLMFDDVFGMLDFGRIRGRRVPSLQILTPELGPRLIAFGGVSKEFAAGGLRFGYAVTSNPVLAEAMRAELLAVPDPLALAAAPEYLGRWQELIQPHRYYLSSKAMALESLFRERHLPFTEVQGGYALFADLSYLHGRRLQLRAGGQATITPQNLHELLYSEAGLKVHAEDWARVRGHYRFVFSIERLDEAVQRLKLFFRSAR